MYIWYTSKTPPIECANRIYYFVLRVLHERHVITHFPLRQPLETTLLCLDVGLCSDACNSSTFISRGHPKEGVLCADQDNVPEYKPMYSASLSLSKQIPTPNIMQNSENSQHPATANRIQQLVAFIHSIFNSLKKRPYQLHRLEQCDEA